MFTKCDSFPDVKDISSTTAVLTCLCVCVSVLCVFLLVWLCVGDYVFVFTCFWLCVGDYVFTCLCLCVCFSGLQALQMWSSVSAN